MTILRRNIDELLNASNRGQSLGAVAPVSRIRRRIGNEYNVLDDEIQRIFTFHMNRVRKVTADMSATDIAESRTVDEIVSRESAKATLKQKNSSLSYISSIDTTRTMNGNVSKGTIRSKRKNISGVTGGVRLF